MKHDGKNLHWSSSVVFCCVISRSYPQETSPFTGSQRWAPQQPSELCCVCLCVCVSVCVSVYVVYPWRGENNSRNKTCPIFYIWNARIAPESATSWIFSSVCFVDCMAYLRKVSNRFTFVDVAPLQGAENTWCKELDSRSYIKYLS